MKYYTYTVTHDGLPNFINRWNEDKAVIISIIPCSYKTDAISITVTHYTVVLQK